MKRRWFKILIYSLFVLFSLILILIGYIRFALPNVGPPPEIQVAGTATQIERGDYLANSVMICMQCHSQRDFSLFAAPSKPGTSGIGGEIHDQRLGFPGKYVSTNLTPYHLAEWSDGELFRAITSGVNRRGKALFPIMPHPNFGKMDPEDIKSVIAYLRTLSPVAYDPEPSHSDFPMNFIINFIPQKSQLQPAPPISDQIAYGEYLVNAASCRSCHTRQNEKGAFVGAEYAGGMEFNLEDGSIVRAANLTPHASGIGNWTKKQFIDQFKLYADSSYVPPSVGPGDFQTVMPWNTYAKMTEADLATIHAYLLTITPVENQVEKFTAKP